MIAESHYSHSVASKNVAVCSQLNCSSMQLQVPAIARMQFGDASNAGMCCFGLLHVVAFSFVRNMMALVASGS